MQKIVVALALLLAASMVSYAQVKPTKINTIEFSDGASVAVSGANKARLRYHLGNNRLEVSLNGAAYAALGVGGGSSTVQDVYDASSNPVRITQDNTRDGLILRANSDGNSPLAIESNGGSNVAHFDADGSLETPALYSTLTVSNSLLIESATANSGSNVGVKLHNATNLSGDTKIVTFGSNSVEKSSIFNDGTFLGPGATLTRDALATTTANAVVLQNTTAATGGATVQVTPSLALESNFWNGAASTLHGVGLYHKPSASGPRLYMRLKNDGGAYADVGWLGFGYLASGFGIGDASGSNWIDINGVAANSIRIVANGASHTLFDATALAPYNDLGVTLGKSTHRWTSSWQRTAVVGDTNANRPTCDSTLRGALFVERATAGNGDIVQACLKGTADTYSWRNVFTAP
jgi:hypothetical protein